MLVENVIGTNGIEQRDKVQTAIKRLRSFEPPEGYWLAFSGGKDSVVIKALADMAGVKYEAHYSLTSVDAPELVLFIKTIHPDVIIDYPEKSMWKLIVDKGFPPTRVIRYCCDELKEHHGKGRVTITGVRWDESAKRKANRHLVDIGRMSKVGFYADDNADARRMVENCYKKSTTTINPIIDWLNEDVWEFIHQYDIPYCSLYDEGFERLGCIGCPLSGNQEKEFARWPKYKEAYLRAFQRMIDRKISNGQTVQAYSNAHECMEWWMGRSKVERMEFDGQIEFGEDLEEAE